MALALTLQLDGLDVDPLSGLEIRERGIAADLFTIRVGLFSASFTLPDRTPPSFVAGPPAARISAQEKPAALERGHGAEGVAERGWKATAKAEPLVGADSPPRATS